MKGTTHTNGSTVENEMRTIEEEAEGVNAGLGRNWHLMVRGKGMGLVQKEKMRLLETEGVLFNADGILIGGEKLVWRPSRTTD